MNPMSITKPLLAKTSTRSIDQVKQYQWISTSLDRQCSIYRVQVHDPLTQSHHMKQLWTTLRGVNDLHTHMKLTE